MSAQEDNGLYKAKRFVPKRDVIDPPSRGERLMAIALRTSWGQENEQAVIKPINMEMNYGKDSNEYILQQFYLREGAYPYAATILNAASGASTKYVYVSKRMLGLLVARDPNHPNQKDPAVSDYHYKGVFKILGDKGINLVRFVKCGPKGMRAELTEEWNKGA